MATGLGEASAVISLIQAANSLVGWAQDVKMAEEERQRLLRETGRLTLDTRFNIRQTERLSNKGQVSRYLVR
jgi:hypothetical protein